jgi:hypothetical protein
VRQAGGGVLKLAHVMASHDCDINSFRQWWRRGVRSGRAYAEGAALHGASPERHWVKERRSILVWGVALPLSAVLLAWPTGGLSIAGLLMLYLALGAKIIRNRVRQWGYSLSDAMIYALFCVIGKLPQAIGLLHFNRKQLVRVLAFGRPLVRNKLSDR